MCSPIRYRGYMRAVVTPHTTKKYHFPRVAPNNQRTGRDLNPADKYKCEDFIPVHDDNDGERDPNAVQYEIRVVTGDVMGAGTDANVFITLCGADGSSGKQQLTKRYTNLFERGRTDCFEMDLPNDIGELTRLTIEHDSAGFGSAWLLNRVEIVNCSSNIMTVFPCDSWLDTTNGTMKELSPQPEDEEAEVANEEAVLAQEEDSN